ncbi:glycosyl hydrolase family 18 protein [Rapidithrix thailandica]|uniref:chitinase n=1 Tax=Rapidithrix thailandica TaxID=413964 RepID=A0AAW9S6V9_9BACT
MKLYPNTPKALWLTKLLQRVRLKAWMLCGLLWTGSVAIAQINSGGQYNTTHHQKQIVGYITQWDAWKGTANGLPDRGVFNQLNIDYSQYTILNFSFFGVAKDGSLHSGDLRNKNIYQVGAVQEPGPLLHPDVYSSWDYWILKGELDLLYNVSEGSPAWNDGYRVVGNSWNNINTGESGNLPVPYPKPGGAPGLLKLCQDNGVKIMASIGGWSMCKHFPEMARDAAKKQRFLDDCVKLINMGFDGIDLDWEYPNSAGMNIENYGQDDYANFLQLVKDIRQAIGPGKLITAAFSANPDKLNGFDWPQLAQNMDYFNMMTYDFEGGWSDNTGHNSNLYGSSGFTWDKTFQYLQTSGVPANKVNMGVAFYGRGVITDGPASLGAATVKRPETVQPDGPIVTCADYTNWPKDVWDGTPNYQAIQQAMGSGWTRHWDDTAKVPYLTKGNYFVSYDDEESIGIKAQYVNDRSAAGVIVWQVFGDLNLGPVTQKFGNKLPYCPSTKSPLVNKLNEVFATGGSGGSAPYVSITAPANGSTIEQNGLAMVDLTATATDTDGTVTGVTFSVDGQTINATASGNTYSGQWMPSSFGEYTITATATDNENLTGNTSSTVTIACVGANCPNANPTVSITSPTNGAVIQQANLSMINLEATASDSDGSVSLVTFAIDGQTLNASGAGNTYSASWTPSAYQSYTLVATVTDNANATSTDSISFTIEQVSGCTTPAWDANTVYVGGNQASHNGNLYRAKWWTQGDEPGTSGPWGPWEDLGPCGNAVQALSESSQDLAEGIPSQNAVGHKIVGYFPSWGGPVSQIQFDKLTHVNYAFALPTASGGLEPLANPSHLQDLVTQAHANNVKVLLAIGGWDIGDGGGNDGRFNTLAADPATRTAFVNTVMQWVSNYNLDGVDMDWEYPDRDTPSSDHFSLLMQELSTALHAQGKLLTAAVVALGWNAGGVKDDVFGYVDFLNIMAYDGGNGELHAPYSYAVDALNYWRGRGLPKAKAVIGVPFYGRPTWKAYKTLIAEGADPNSDTFVSNGSTVYYNGITTIKAKAQLSMQEGGGIMIWELSHDTQDQTSLLRAIHEEIVPPCSSNCDPVVDITAPVNNSTIEQFNFEPVNLSASAYDQDGNITSAQFYVDGQSASTSGSAGNYSATWTPSAYGTYTISITVTDNDNKTATDQVMVTIAEGTLCSAPVWDAGTVYVGGDEVTHNGNLFRAKWWTLGDEPGTGGAWGPWEDLGACGSAVAKTGLASKAEGSADISVLNYPNPFTYQTTIRFTLPSRSQTTLRLLNLQGQEVSILLNKELEKGNHKVDVDASTLPNGLYIYQLTVGQITRVGRMLKK